ncbi:MAG: hypothetical protein IPG43_18355 [Proteobacteria bacterium]|nr:hypothetical protein [Pseudomonadota bacterium]
MNSTPDIGCASPDTGVARLRPSPAAVTPTSTKRPCRRFSSASCSSTSANDTSRKRPGGPRKFTSRRRLQVDAADHRIAIELGVDMPELGRDLGEGTQGLHFTQGAGGALLVGKHRQHHVAIGGYGAGQVGVAAVAIGGLGEHDVEGHRAHADAGQTLEQLRMHVA